MTQRTELRGLRLPGPPSISGALQTLLAALVVCPEVLVLAPILVLVASRWPALQEAVIRHWTRMVLYMAGVELKVEGAEKLDPKGRYVFMSNHQSLFDVPCLVNALANPLRFVAKRSLFKIPVFGAALRAIGTIDIDRGDRADAIRRLQEAQQGIARRCCLHFFAEGTRSPDGGLLPFKKGGAVMALSLGVPIIPIAISGTRKVFPKGGWSLRPGPVLVSIGEPIMPGADSPEERTRLVAQVRDEVARLLAALGEQVDAPGAAGKEVSSGI